MTDEMDDGRRATFTSRPMVRLVALVLLTFLAYLPALRAGYIWDDDAYVTENVLLHDAHGLSRIWFDIGATPQYYPLTFTSFWLEYQAWGLKPAGYHVVNVALHAAGAVLLVGVLLRLGVRGAWVAGFVFALHPVMVESVAWITERKNTLSLALALGSLLCFLQSRWIEPGESTQRRWLTGGAVLYGLALLSKTVVAPLPLVLILIGYAKFGRVPKRVMLGVLPLLTVGASMGLLTAGIERTSVGASGGEFRYADTLIGEAGYRTIVAGRAVLFYVSKLVVPYPLVFNYPRWEIDVGSVTQWLAPMTVLGLTVGLFVARERLGRWPVVVWVTYCGLLFPALGFVNVFPHLYSWVADHFQYHAAPVFCGVMGVLFTRIPRAVASSLGVLGLVVLTGLTYAQAGHYKDVETIWRHTRLHNPRSWLADTALGTIEASRGQYDVAEMRFNRSIKWMKAQYRGQKDAGFGLPYYQLGVIAEARDDPALAERQYRAAIDLDPSHGPARHNLAVLLLVSGRVDEAEAQWTEATQAPAMRFNADLPRRAGMALQQLGHPDRADKWFKLADERTRQASEN